MKKKKILSLITTLILSVTTITSTVVSVNIIEVSATSSETALTDSSSIKTIQALLNYIGYDCGTPDGVAGTNTKNAVSEYEKSKGKTPTGQLTASLLADLYADVMRVLENTSQTYSDVLTTLSTNDSNCSSAPQQAANGAYRAADMLSVITKSMDTNNKYQSDIASIQLNQILNNSTCDSAAQQEINGLYRVVDFLGILAKQLDKTSSNSSDIEDVLTKFDTQDATCSKTPQQAVNGSYRAVELLNIIAKCRFVKHLLH